MRANNNKAVVKLTRLKDRLVALKQRRTGNNLSFIIFIGGILQLHRIYDTARSPREMGPYQLRVKGFSYRIGGLDALSRNERDRSLLQLETFQILCIAFGYLGNATANAGDVLYTRSVLSTIVNLLSDTLHFELTIVVCIVNGLDGRL